jgi:hypothetical protein
MMPATMSTVKTMPAGTMGVRNQGLPSVADHSVRKPTNQATPHVSTMMVVGRSKTEDILSLCCWLSRNISRISAGASSALEAAGVWFVMCTLYRKPVC